MPSPRCTGGGDHDTIHLGRASLPNRKCLVPEANVKRKGVHHMHLSGRALPSMHKVLGSIPSSTGKETNKILLKSIINQPTLILSNTQPELNAGSLTLSPPVTTESKQMSQTRDGKTQP
jgi:hypothetical protein